MALKRHSPHFRIIMRKNHIWFSELLGIILVITIITALLVMGGVIFFNHLILRKSSHLISQLDTERIVITYKLNVSKEKNRIAAVLDNFTNERLSEKTLRVLANLVYKNSKTYGYDPFLVLSVIHVESMFDTEAKGQYRNGKFSGALGLMQLKPGTARDVAKDLEIPFKEEKDLFVPEINIALGVAYLTQMISFFKSLKLGILAYNQGPYAIKKLLKNNQPLSVKYYNKVLKTYFALKKISGE